MPGWLEALFEALGEKYYVPNADKVRDWFLKSPLFVAILFIVPIVGVLLAYGTVLYQAKVLVFLFVDILMGFALPVYPFYKLLMAYDVWVLAKRRKSGKKLGGFEFCWN